MADMEYRKQLACFLHQRFDDCIASDAALKFAAKEYAIVRYAFAPHISDERIRYDLNGALSLLLSDGRMEPGAQGRYHFKKL